MTDRTTLRHIVTAALAAVLAGAAAPALAATPGPHDQDTQTPIKHLILVVGTGNSFDHLFATYVPPTGQVSNLLAKGIVRADGTLGTQAAALYEPALATGFVNVQKGEMPYLKSLADQYVLADNDHQAVTGGSFANSMMLAYADPAAVPRNDDTPPAKLRSIADSLMASGVSWGYYGEGWSNSLAGRSADYCADCNPFQFDATVMGNPVVRDAHLKNTAALDADIRDDELPAVTYVRPGLHDSGAADIAAFEAFTKHVVTAVQANQKLWGTTAIFITMDDSGDTYDAGYVQHINRAGDGPRVPLLIVSPYTVNFGVRHNYVDHASVVKFIDENWGLKPISDRSLDNLPNPMVMAGHVYVPMNIPAIGSMMDFFNFPQLD